MKLTLKEIVNATGAKLVKGSFSDETFAISTDTRTICNGDIYLPLKGESFDGENFVANAVKSGANGYFCTKKNETDAEIILKVEDTKEAYMLMASFLRKKYSPKTIAITGSSGKTTTKEMVFATMNSKFKTHKTALNHNNEIGFCQTVFSMPENCEVLILEMGMRGFGEIDLIVKYALPDVAIISNVGTAHIGRLGSRENIAKAKCEITKYLSDDGVLIAHDDELIKSTTTFMGKKLFYSIKDVEILEKKVGYSKFLYKGFEYELNVDGDYNIENALSAIEAGLSLNMTPEEIKEGLKNYKPIEKRWETEEIKGFKVINDSYNANPESTKASVKTFLEFYENPIVIFGDMGELGENELEYHRELGKTFAEIAKTNNKEKIVKFLTVGKLSKSTAEELDKQGIFAKNFEKNEDAARYILDNVNKGTTIFLKASRSMKFEEIIEHLKGL